ncbi:MAG TPA: condensation domain-containing protein, partial [Caldilineaceae bacterium]|nr:condensation domain-containing protein [Caldilineaceae bacterium]
MMTESFVAESTTISDKVEGDRSATAVNGSVPQATHYSLAHSQEDFWFLHQSSPESAAYNAAFTARIVSPIDIDAFRTAWQQLAQRHAILRTRFPLVDGRPMQVVEGNLDGDDSHDSDCAIDFALVDASAWPDDSVQTTITNYHELPFDLELSSPWRVRLFALAEDEFVLLFSFHHILMDLWSMMVLITEVGETYAALSAKQPIPALKSAQSFIEYTSWHSELLQSATGGRQRAYWEQQVAKVTNGADALQLPTDRPLPPVRTFNGDLLTTALPADLLPALNQLAADSNTTLFTTLLAAFQVLLHRYTAHEEILVGVPMSGRRRAEFDRTLGCIANQTFVLTEMGGEPSFRDVLGQVQRGFMGAMLHQEYPYRLMTQALPQNGDRSRPPLAQVIFNLPLPPQMKHFVPFFCPQENANHAATVEWGGLTLQPFFIKQQAGQFFLMVEVWGSDDDYTLLWRYNTDLFDASTIERMAGCYQTLLAGILADPDQPISRLPLLTAAEEEQILVTWNDTARPVPTDKCIHHLFEEQVERTPEAIALVSPLEEKRLTYRELNQRANQLAHHLQARGVGPDTLVGICVERSLDMIVGLMAVLKAGGAYVPMDPNYPTDRLGFMLAESAAPILLTQEKCLPALPAHNAQVICLDRDWPTIAQASTTNPVSAVAPHHRVYCIFTSGSTGRPKGAQITHQNFVSNLYAYVDAYQVHETVTSTLQMASFSFDMFGADLQRTLWHGAKLVICPQEWLLDPERLYALMCTEQVDFAQFVPAVLRSLVNYLEKTGQDLRFMNIL